MPSTEAVDQKETVLGGLVPAGSKYHPGIQEDAFAFSRALGRPIPGRINAQIIHPIGFDFIPVPLFTRHFIAIDQADAPVFPKNFFHHIIRRTGKEEKRDLFVPPEAKEAAILCQGCFINFWNSVTIVNIQMLVWIDHFFDYFIFSRSYFVRILFLLNLHRLDLTISWE
jgi:hypothetical protein